MLFSVFEQSLPLRKLHLSEAIFILSQQAWSSSTPWRMELSGPSFHRTNGLFRRCGEEEEALTHPGKTISSEVGGISAQGWDQQKPFNINTNAKALVLPKWNAKSYHYNSLLWILLTQVGSSAPILCHPVGHQVLSVFVPKYLPNLCLLCWSYGHLVISFILFSFKWFSESLLCKKL